MDEVMNGTDPLAVALVAAQLEMPELEKNAVNPHFKNRFMSLDNLIAKTRPVLNRHGLAIAQFPTLSEQGGLVLTTVLLHGDSGERLEFDTPLLGGAENMQQLGAAITYARRYAWQAVLGVAAEEDTDGETTKQPAGRKKPAVKAITRDQQRRLFAIAGENGVSLEVLREIVVGVTGAESTSAIPVDRYDEIVSLVKEQSLPFDPKEAGRMNTIEQPEPNEVETVEVETEEQENVEEEQQPDEEPAEEESRYVVPASVRQAHEQRVEQELLEFAEPVDTPSE